MRIFFARHGQTDWNVQAKVQGSTDIPLNDTGIMQARQLCDNLKKENVNPYKVYTSYQKRAVKTAEIVGEEFKVPVEVLDGLEEMSLGLFEGHTWDEIYKLYPKELEEWNSYKRYNKSPEGESYQMVMERLFRALDKIIERGEADKADDKEVLIVTHGAVVMTLIAMQNNIPFEQSHTIFVKNATPVEFTMSELEEIRKRV